MNMNDEPIEYFKDTEGNENVTADQIDDAVSMLRKYRKNRQDDQARRSPSVSSEPQGAVRREALANAGMVEDSDGNLHYDNGKLAGPSPVQANPNMESEKIRARLNAMKLGEKSEETLGMEEALKSSVARGQTRIVKPGEKMPDKNDVKPGDKMPDKNDVGPRVAVVGGQESYADRRRKFVMRNKNAVSQQERERVLGKGGARNGAEKALLSEASVTDGTENTNGAVNMVMSDPNLAEALQNERDAAGKRKTSMNNRRIALGTAIGVALNELNDNGVIKEEKDKDGNVIRRYKTYQIGVETIKSMNEARRGNGSKDDYSSILAYVEVDSNGRPIGKPMIAAKNTADGQSGNGKATFRKWSIDQLEPKLLDAYMSDGRTKQEDAERKVFETLGMYGTIGRSAYEKRKADEAKAALETRRQDEVERSNNENEDIKRQELDIRRRNHKGEPVTVKDVEFSNERISDLKAERENLLKDGGGMSMDEAKKKLAEIDGRIADFEGIVSAYTKQHGGRGGGANPTADGGTDAPVAKGGGGKTGDGVTDEEYNSNAAAEVLGERNAGGAKPAAGGAKPAEVVKPTAGGQDGDAGKKPSGSAKEVANNEEPTKDHNGRSRSVSISNKEDEKAARNVDAFDKEIIGDINEVKRILIKNYFAHEAKKHMKEGIVKYLKEKGASKEAISHALELYEKMEIEEEARRKRESGK